MGTHDLVSAESKIMNRKAGQYPAPDLFEAVFLRQRFRGTVFAFLEPGDARLFEIGWSTTLSKPSARGNRIDDD